MRRHVPALTASLLLAAAVTASAQTDAPAFWRAATRADFLKGDVEHLTLDEHGRLTLGPTLTPVFDPAAPVAWSVLPMADGTTWVGTGHDGQLYRVGADGRGHLVFDAPEVGIHALVAAPGGAVYAGTSPDGRIYRVGSDGRAEPFFDPEERYIWALAVEPDGHVLAATGDPHGRVYRIAPDGRSETLYTAPATHVTALLAEAGRVLWLGTDSPGRVYRLDETRRPFLVADTGFREVRALRRAGDGALYALALSGRAPAAPADVRPDTAATPAAAVAAPATGGAIVTVLEVASAAPAAGAASPARDAAAGATGAVLRIDADGLVRPAWMARDDVPYDLLVEPSGTLLLATGPKARLYRLAGVPLRATLLGRVDAEQLVALGRAGDRVVLTTANPGRLVALSAQPATRGTYTSEVRDSGGIATWGALSWRSTQPEGSRLEFSTRAGNTAVPDEAWSDWSAVRTDGTSTQVTSPRARYLQWRATFTAHAASPALSAVTLAYRPQNHRPEVSAITVHPPGVVFQKPYSTGETEIAGLPADPPEKRLAQQGQPPAPPPAPGRRLWQRGLQTLGWRAEDANADPLEFDLDYRRDGDSAWLPLARGLTEPLYVWDTATVPGGAYTVRVLASDRLTHSAAEALTGELESETVLVDTAAPSVTLGAPRRDGTSLVVAVDAVDRDSAIVSVDYSVEGAAWQPVRPETGLLDSLHERLDLRLPADLAGRTVVVRVTDALQNTTTATVRLLATR